jgi:hypothetical protein
MLAGPIWKPSTALHFGTLEHNAWLGTVFRQVVHVHAATFQNARLLATTYEDALGHEYSSGALAKSLSYKAVFCGLNRQEFRLFSLHTVESRNAMPRSSSPSEVRTYWQAMTAAVGVGP